MELDNGTNNMNEHPTPDNADTESNDKIKPIGNRYGFIFKTKRHGSVAIGSMTLGKQIDLSKKCGDLNNIDSDNFTQGLFDVLALGVIDEKNNTVISTLDNYILTNEEKDSFALLFVEKNDWLTHERIKKEVDDPQDNEQKVIYEEREIGFPAVDDPKEILRLLFIKHRDNMNKLIKSSLPTFMNESNLSKLLQANQMLSEKLSSSMRGINTSLGKYQDICKTGIENMNKSILDPLRGITKAIDAMDASAKDRLGSLSKPLADLDKTKISPIRELARLSEPIYDKELMDTVSKIGREQAVQRTRDSRNLQNISEKLDSLIEVSSVNEDTASLTRNLNELAQEGMKYFKNSQVRANRLLVATIIISFLTLIATILMPFIQNHIRTKEPVKQQATMPSVKTQNTNLKQKEKKTENASKTKKNESMEKKQSNSNQYMR